MLVPMKRNLTIAQLSDIHLGGHYNGRFGTEEHLDVVLSNLRRDEIDLIIVSGDISEDNECQLANYKVVREKLVKTQIPFAVLPGNHDSIDMMKTVFTEDEFNESVLELNNNIVLWNDCPKTGKFDDESLSRLAGHKVVFCHLPLCTVNHVFMSQYQFGPDAAKLQGKLAQLGVEHVFCGHVHWPSIVQEAGITTYIDTAVQAELDPEDSNLHPYAASYGYAIMSMASDGRKIGYNVYEVTYNFQRIIRYPAD